MFIVLMFIVLVIFMILLFYIIKTNKNNFVNIKVKEYFNLEQKNLSKKDVRQFSTKNTIIIVGKGPNLDEFINNYKYFKKFKKLGLNNSILVKDIKFDYYFQQDFSPSVSDEYVKEVIGKNEYSNKVINLKNKNNHIDYKKYFDYAINNNIKPIIPKIKYDNGTTPKFNILPEFLKKNKNNKYINFIHTKTNLLGKINNIYYIPKVHPPTCFVPALVYCINSNYKNIFITGITMYNNNHTIRNKYKKFLKLIKNKYPDVNIYCIFPMPDTKDIFDYNIV